ncbi:hypothetical protein [Agrobacterium tumefaciens]|uniref:hypothetical protein n=1 Tax=Agrobacterium tumefaciens TaxID=358 RepID=UPI0016596F1D|nr:hypothetical protein [Agrobacterium tumefaciens]QNP80991.1 hypothetical protein IAI05_07065 [Agrobacterium tumefaciens]
MDKDHLAQEAARLKKDPVFLEVLSRIRNSAVEQLIKTNVDEKTLILTLQAFAKVCDVFPVELEAMILSKEEKRPIKAV